MIRVSVKSDFDRAARALDAIKSQQLPYATARALNDAAAEARQRVTNALPQIFDRPTSFTLQGLAIKTASKTSLQSEVFIKPIQAGYLLHEEIGGTRIPAENSRVPSAQALIVPGAIGLDAHGNIPSGALKRLAAQIGDKAGRKAKRRKAVASVKSREQGVFYLKGHGIGGRNPGGYFRRLADDKVQRLTGFEPSTHYHAIFHFRTRVEQAVRATFRPALMRRLREAIASSNH